MSWSLGFDVLYFKGHTGWYMKGVIVAWLSMHCSFWFYRVKQDVISLYGVGWFVRIIMCIPVGSKLYPPPGVERMAA